MRCSEPLRNHRRACTSFDDAFGDERTACFPGKMLGADTDRQRVADRKRRRRQIEAAEAGAGHARMSGGAETCGVGGHENAAKISFRLSRDADHRAI